MILRHASDIHPENALKKVKQNIKFINTQYRDDIVLKCYCLRDYKAISNCIDSFNWIKLRCCVHRRVKIKVGFATAVSQSSVFIGPS